MRRGWTVDVWAVVGGAVGCGLWALLALLATSCGRVDDQSPDARPGVSAGSSMPVSSAPAYDP